MDFGKYLGWIKLPPKYLIGIAIATSILIFAPESVTLSLGVKEIVNEHRKWIGAAFLISLALLVSHVLMGIYDFFKPTIRALILVRQAKKNLKYLSSPEKEALSKFVLSESKTQTFDIRSGVARGLEDSRIIYRASEIGSLTSFSYNLQPWAWKALRENPDLLEPELTEMKKEHESQQKGRNKK